jgi:hypothetical protein
MGGVLNFRAAIGAAVVHGPGAIQAEQNGPRLGDRRPGGGFDGQNAKPLASG